MGGAVLLVGPFVAAVGLVAVIFVMRHRSVQTKSMYSARRGQIERKVRAARQRTLAPTGRHPEKDAAQDQQFAAPGMEAKTAVPTATWGAPATPPAAEPVWEVGPTVPPPPPSMPPPVAPKDTPAEPAYTPPEPAYPVAPESEWAPAAAQPPAPTTPEPIAKPIESPMSTSTGGGAAWSIVGESKAGDAEPAADKKSKKEKGKEKEQQAQAGSWQLASGVAPGEEDDEVIKKPSATVAIAQYAVLVVGLVMVLIGVVVMVANSHVT